MNEVELQGDQIVIAVLGTGNLLQGQGQRSLLHYCTERNDSSLLLVTCLDDLPHVLVYCFNDKKKYKKYFIFHYIMSILHVCVLLCMTFL